MMCYRGLDYAIMYSAFLKFSFSYHIDTFLFQSLKYFVINFGRLWCKNCCKCVIKCVCMLLCHANIHYNITNFKCNLLRLLTLRLWCDNTLSVHKRIKKNPFQRRSTIRYGDTANPKKCGTDTTVMQQILINYFLGCNYVTWK